jgi:micrococcal nuclease
MSRRGKRSASDRLRFGTLIVVVAGISIIALTSDPQNNDEPLFVEETFRLCMNPPHFNCVIDGDTFYARNQSIRIANIDAPEIALPECAAEARVGLEASDRLLELLNSGAFELNRNDTRDTDEFGRLLRTVTAQGVSIGGVLVAEGLAREWDGPNVDWRE